jgi:hypothetical protein
MLLLHSDLTLSIPIVERRQHSRLGFVTTSRNGYTQTSRVCNRHALLAFST